MMIILGTHRGLPHYDYRKYGAQKMGDLGRRTIYILIDPGLAGFKIHLVFIHGIGLGCVINYSEQILTSNLQYYFAKIC
jgi:hypothetical protein